MYSQLSSDGQGQASESKNSARFLMVGVAFGVGMLLAMFSPAFNSAGASEGTSLVGVLPTASRFRSIASLGDVPLRAFITTRLV
jgi:hypothetical protein